MAIFMGQFDLAVTAQVSLSEANKYRAAWGHFDSDPMDQGESIFIKMQPGEELVETRLMRFSAYSSGAQSAYALQAQIIEGGTEPFAGVDIPLIDPCRARPRDGHPSMPRASHAKGLIAGGTQLWSQKVVGQNPSGQDLDFVEMSFPLAIDLPVDLPLYLVLTNLAGQRTGSVLSVALGFAQKLS